MSIEEARTIGDGAVSALDSEIGDLMERAVVRFLPLIATLDIGPDGKIRPTAANIENVNGVLDRMSALLFDDGYLRAVADYLDGMNDVSAAVSSGLESFGADSELTMAIAKRAKVAVASALLSPSSFRGLFAAISAQLINGVATSASAASVSDGVKQVMLQ